MCGMNERDVIAVYRERTVGDWCNATLVVDL